MKKKQYFYEALQFEYDYSVNASWDNTPFSFPTHWHTIGEIVYVTKKGTRFQVQEKEYCLDSGDILFIWPGELHATIQAEEHSHLIIQYYSHLLDVFPDMMPLCNSLLSRHYLSASVPGSPAAEIAEYMNQIKDNLKSNLPLNNMRLCLSLYHILLIFFDYCTANKNADSAENRSHRMQTLETITKACCYISEHCDHDLSLEEVSDYVGLSKFHFSRSFKEYTQFSFNDYIAHQRIQKAIFLFENPDISIAEAAFQSGFGSIPSFYRCFKKEKKCSPSEYRNMMQKPH